MSDQQIELTLPASGERIDRALTEAMPELSRTQWQRLIEDGLVTVGGRTVKSSLRLDEALQVSVILPEVVDTSLVAESIPLDIRYEDDDIILINKPAGMVVHPSTGHNSGTLVNAILAHCPSLLGVGGERRPGIVHRLDKDTSGLILVAKNDHALHYLQAQFKARTIKKVYLALVEGQLQPPSAIVDAPIGRDKRRRKKMSVITNPSEVARPAQTQYETLLSFDEYTLVECRPKTGRTHQIRVHLAHIGFPIVGDKVYGRRKQRLLTTRHFLHAAGLTFQRPSDEQELTFRVELPSDLQAVLDSLSA
ncbi:MAG: RluA family pseudouridine synthase [Anaerolineae bacterium]